MIEENIRKKEKGKKRGRKGIGTEPREAIL